MCCRAVLDGSWKANTPLIRPLSVCVCVCVCAADTTED